MFVFLESLKSFFVSIVFCISGFFEYVILFLLKEDLVLGVIDLIQCSFQDSVDIGLGNLNLALQKLIKLLWKLPYFCFRIFSLFSGQNYLELSPMFIHQGKQNIVFFTISIVLYDTFLMAFSSQQILESIYIVILGSNILVGWLFYDAKAQFLFCWVNRKDIVHKISIVLFIQLYWNPGRRNRWNFRLLIDQTQINWF